MRGWEEAVQRASQRKVEGHAWVERCGRAEAGTSREGGTGGWPEAGRRRHAEAGAEAEAEASIGGGIEASKHGSRGGWPFSRASASWCLRPRALRVLALCSASSCPALPGCTGVCGHWFGLLRPRQRQEGFFRSAPPCAHDAPQVQYSGPASCG